MRNIRIMSVSAHNFKGFKELHVDFSGNNAVVLGGMNGFGKTTVFDALELLFTGTIQRMESYAPFHDQRGSLSQEALPLVYDKNYCDQVKVVSTLQVENRNITIVRYAKVDEMSNPVDFGAFSEILTMSEENKFRPLTEDEKSFFAIDDLHDHYSFLNYLSQEEATAFLKSKEVDRASVISKLFNLEPYDNPLGIITNLLNALKPKLHESDDRINNLQNFIESLQLADNVKRDNGIEYKQICIDSQYWDVENPQLDNGQFDALLSENGIIDNLFYFCQHKGEFKQYRLNQYIDNVSSEDTIIDIVFWIKYRGKEQLLKLYGDFQTKLNQPLLELTLTNLSSFTLEIPDNLSDFVKDEDIEEFNIRLTSLLSLYKSTNAIQREMAEMLQRRDNLAMSVLKVGNDLTPKACPLCGKEYNDVKGLAEDIGKHGEIIRKNLSNASDSLMKQLEMLKSFMTVHFINPISKHFTEQNINLEQYEQYTKLDKAKIEEYISQMSDKLKIEFDETLDDILLKQSLLSQLDKLRKPLPDNVDFRNLSSIYSTYGRYIKPDCLNEADLKVKRNYLLSERGKKNSKLMKDQQENLAKEKKRHEKLKELHDDLNNLKKEITNKRQAYFSQLLQDIQILFYIYSGRIMQTNYYGRGLFIKPDEKCKHIIFTTSFKSNNEVDALYNMSSGQLVSLTVALLLSLNKLYSNVNLLAIDDPIQTIDDINFWGLIETLRHDFNDYFMILSTHESDYGSLLEYKFNKFNINTKFIDMAHTKSER